MHVNALLRDRHLFVRVAVHSTKWSKSKMNRSEKLAWMSVIINAAVLISVLMSA
jgi:hypothetical protein